VINRLVFSYKQKIYSLGSNEKPQRQWTLKQFRDNCKQMTLENQEEQYNIKYIHFILQLFLSYLRSILSDIYPCYFCSGFPSYLGSILFDIIKWIYPTYISDKRCNKPQKQVYIIFSKRRPTAVLLELGLQPHPLVKFFGQNWLDLGKFGWIWAKSR